MIRSTDSLEFVPKPVRSRRLPLKLQFNLQVRRLALMTGCFFLLGAAGSAHSEPVVVTDLKGHKVSPLNGGNRKGTVLFFITNDCPIANAYAPEIERIYRAYAPKQVACYLVYVDNSLSETAARKHHDEYGYTFPALFDPAHQLVRLAKASVTPECAIFDPKGRLLYHGRIDDRAVGFGQVRVTPTRHDLREQLDELIRGKTPSVKYTPAVGCFIANLPHQATPSKK